MVLEELEQVVAKYKRFQYCSSDNISREEYISYSFWFDAIKIRTSYPSLIVLMDGNSGSTFSFWNVRNISIEERRENNYDVVKCDLLNPHDQSKTPQNLTFRAYKS